MKIVRAIRQGRILPSKPKTLENKPAFYPLWDTPASDHPAPAPAPKPRLPTNAESYNPPEEYLPTAEEKKEWEELDKEDRERDYLPQKYSSLRHVPAYPEFINNRFERLLDLYLAPRIQRRRLDIDPDSLIPTLPSPQSLRPFPTYRSLHEKRHLSRARCVAISPDDEWAISGDDTGVVALWEVSTGHQACVWRFEQKVGSLAWCPRKDVLFFAVGLDEEVVLITPLYVKGVIASATKSLFEGNPTGSNTGGAVEWTAYRGTATSTEGTLQSIRLPRATGKVMQIAFHRKGDYFTSLSVAGSGTGQSTVWIHQTSKRHSQAPFKNVKGSIQKTLFHPSKPHFFVATQRYVRMYDLAEQRLLKTFMPGIKWISSLDIHPSGDHFIVGGYDRKLCWFDLELSDKPYKVLRYHARAIRSVAFHPTYPLFASCSDDGSIQIFHARVYNDLMTDPLIVPLKILRGGHAISDGLGVLEVGWLHSRPWLVSAGADGQVAVWCP
ncbi:hypothetical protein M408DRAFT_330013 [Serendipita vermifera MAFF 305830]|uniref:BOP1 N-terminal domain-containing protein n=1 Tax=Serendipita vermifera MAFF 305830 TaxID=933852 RepID=A0A0C3B822_SERVB|nr:hypothetical protein M408DRAFT_330013 [Serendipita vermifera MAFF 305830]